MEAITPTLMFILNLSKVQTVINRKFDAKLSAHGLGFSDFVILHYLALAQGNKLRRIDLAEQIGITASGITRMLVPMEKMGLVGRETNERDARVSYVVLAIGGRKLYEESVRSAEYAAAAVLPADRVKKLERLGEVMRDIML